MIQMPGPHIEMKLMQCFADVGGCDLWQGSCWEGCHQWWIGWHHPNNIMGWSWPSDYWVLIEVREVVPTAEGDPRLLEAFYLGASATMPCSQWLLAYLLQPHKPTDLATMGRHSPCGG